jgi:tRNA nucleotidyltransferase (CCA-adding enzyme)
MPEYTYLLEKRLSAAQQNALTQVRDAAREAGMVVFLAGGAVRDLTTGSSVRDLDFAVQGNVLDLQKALEARGATLLGRHEPTRSLFLWFPGSVRVEVSSTRSEAFPKPGKPVYTWSGIVDDLYRRDFTVNAMALSLNEGSYGLLLDPLNGVADTEARQLRLVSNYGFIEDPARLLRAIRLSRRMGWALEERTEARYQNAKEADTFGDISDFHRGYELEEIAVEEDSLATLKAYEAEGWMQKLFPGWSSSHADTAALDNLHRMRIQLLMQGITPDLTAAHLELLSAKMKPDSKKAFKHMMVRTGLLSAWEGLEAAAKDFSKLLTSKEMAVPSASWNLFHTHAAEPILWLAFTGKGAAETKFKQMFTVWPEVAKKVPVTMMTELRITPELPVYEELLHELFLQQIDGKLETDEAMRAFLETYSPPAPPPPVNLKRSRTKKSAAKGKRKGAPREADLDRDDDRDEDSDSDNDQIEGGRLPHDEDDDHEGDAHESEAGDAEDVPVPKSAPEPKPVTKSGAEKTGDKTISTKKSTPVKSASPNAREQAAIGAVNLEGVDLGAVLERIQSAGAPVKPAAKVPAGKTHSPAAPVKTAPKQTPPVKPVPESPSAAAKPVAAKASVPQASKTPVKAPAKTAAPEKPDVKATAAVKKQAAGKSPAKAAVPVKISPIKAVVTPGKTSASTKPTAKIPSKVVSKALPAKKKPAPKAPTPKVLAPTKKASHAKATPVPSKKAVVPAKKLMKKPAPAKQSPVKQVKGPAKKKPLPAKKSTKR